MNAEIYTSSINQALAKLNQDHFDYLAEENVSFQFLVNPMDTSLNYRHLKDTFWKEYQTEYIVVGLFKRSLPYLKSIEFIQDFAENLSESIPNVIVMFFPPHFHNHITHFHLEDDVESLMSYILMMTTDIVNQSSYETIIERNNYFTGCDTTGNSIVAFPLKLAKLLAN